MKEKEFIKCPYCDTVQIGIIDHSSAPFSIYIHDCESCGVKIMESEWEPVKALSIKQPFAFLIAHGIKTIENRNSLKNFRGHFLIHAGAKFDDHWRDKIKYSGIIKMIEVLMERNADKLKCGGIIGHAEITDCLQKCESVWFTGKNGFVVERPKPIPFVKCKGQLSFFTPKILNHGN